MDGNDRHGSILNAKAVVLEACARGPWSVALLTGRKDEYAWIGLLIRTVGDGTIGSVHGVELAIVTNTSAV